MNCEEARRLIGAYSDGELDLVEERTPRERVDLFERFVQSQREIRQQRV